MIILWAPVYLLFAAGYEYILISPVITALFGTIVFGLLIYSSVPIQERRFLVAIFICGFALRAYFAFVIYYVSKTQGASGYYFYSPEEYEILGRYIAQTWRKGQWFSFAGTNRQSGYPYYVGVIFSLVGYNEISVTIVNGLFSALTSIFIYYIAKYIYSQKVAKIAAILTTFFPDFIMMSGVLQKDILIAFIICLILWTVFKINKRVKMSWIIILIAAILYLYMLRRPVSVFLALFIGLYFIFVLTKKSTAYIFPIMMVITLISAVFISGVYDLSNISFFREKYYSVEGIQDNINPDETSMFAPLAGANFFSKIYLIPIAVIFFLISPFPPWRLTGMQAFQIPGNLVWYVLIPFSAYGFLYSLRKKSDESLFLSGIVIFGILAGAIASYGTLGRYRIQIMPLNMILAAIGITQYRKWRELLSIYWGLFVSGILFYTYRKYPGVISTHILFPLLFMTTICIYALLRRMKYSPR